jgi:hypothetical protein
MIRLLSLHDSSCYRSLSGDRQPTSFASFSPSSSSSSVVLFERQLYEFYMDFNPLSIVHVRKIAWEYRDRQKEYWQALYRKYHVTSVRHIRTYPSLADVFDGGMTTKDIKDDEEDEEQRMEAIMGEKETIKLGLGDFIFYSVLVARAAMHSFPTFIASFLCIIVVIRYNGISIYFYPCIAFHPLSRPSDVSLW